MNDFSSILFCHECTTQWNVLSRGRASPVMQVLRLHYVSFSQPPHTFNTEFEQMQFTRVNGIVSPNMGIYVDTSEKISAMQPLDWWMAWESLCIMWWLLTCFAENVEAKNNGYEYTEGQETCDCNVESKSRIEIIRLISW